MEAEQSTELSGSEREGSTGRGRGSNADSSNLDALTGRLRQAKKGSEEEFEEFIANNWQKFVGVVVVVVIAVWLVNEFRTASRAREGDVATSFAEAQQQFAAVYGVAAQPPAVDEENPDGKDKDKKNDAFVESFSRLESGQSGKVYGDLSKLYLATASYKKGKHGEAQEALASFNVESYKGISEPKPVAPVDASSLSKELAALVYVRSMLEKDGEGSLAEAREILRGLTYGGKITNVEALVALIRISVDRDSRTAAIEVAEKLIKARPELGTNIKQELSTMGIKLEETEQVTTTEPPVSSVIQN